MIDALEELGLLDDDEIELDRAALTLSALDHEGMDIEPYHVMLDEMQERLAEVSEDAETVEDHARALRQVYHLEHGFVGDAQGYGAPVNADFIRVLDRRHGLPVSLSILYVAAARAMGWSAYALNTPGHVLVRLGDERFTLLDPFNGGIPVGKSHLKQMLQAYVGEGAQVRPEYLAPVPNRAVLVRLLRNQASRADQAGDVDRAAIVHERMTRIAPEYPDVWWELAQLQMRRRDTDGARDSLSAMLEVTRDPALRKTVTDTLDSLAAAAGRRDPSS
jgi:regulator of sirC expression with transglutaminase-like and TPR domain